jgi:dipeptide/tripeptide permease
MKAMIYALGLMLLGIMAGLLIQVTVGVALIAVGAGFLLYSLIGVVDTDTSHRQEELDSRADELRRQHTLF